MGPDYDEFFCSWTSASVTFMLLYVRTVAVNTSRCCTVSQSYVNDSLPEQVRKLWKDWITAVQHNTVIYFKREACEAQSHSISTQTTV